MVILEAVDLFKRYPVRGTDLIVNAVNGVSLSLAAGETLGIVGESGCGKSTTARLLMRLITPDEGDVIIDGKRVGPDGMSLREMRRQMQMVFQDSFASLNPRLTIEDTIAFGPMVQPRPISALSRRVTVSVCLKASGTQTGSSTTTAGGLRCTRSARSGALGRSPVRSSSPLR